MIGTASIDKGVNIPQIGLGTFDLKAEEILAGIQVGYRLLDTAWQYRNEGEVGKAVKESGIKREEITITTKLWTEDIRKNRVREECEESLRALQMDYVDLYLIHWPAKGFECAWEIMTRLKEEGKIKAAGVSNFQEHHLEALERVSKMRPALNQIECHPYFRNEGLIKYCLVKDIAAQAWCPLGGSYSQLVSDHRLKPLAEKYRKTPAQIVLRWHLQRNVLIIPRTSNRQHLVSNQDIFDFRLDSHDMEEIDSMDTGHRIGADPDCFDF